MNTSERLKYIRQKTGLSQVKFACFLDEKLSRINSIEAGKQVKFPYDLAEKILKKMPDEQYSFKWIATGEGEPFVKSPLSPEEEPFLNRGKALVKTISENITDTELELLSECLKSKKELTFLALKKLLQDEKAIKTFLLEN
ncbi:MAG TPA: helix-turn-helix transcriptional regulator [Candidatus Gastranaerophilales bacterium]|nr:helix-turn-helix transcriptional regulator [Candidatus Gastranaerophilales bacterium]